MREKQENSIQAFTFYASYFDGAKYLSEEEQKEFLSAIPAYVFMGKEPDFKSGPLKMAWTFIVPTLDSGIANRQNGKKGGRKPKEKSANENPACKAPLESPVLNPALFSEKKNLPKSPTGNLHPKATRTRRRTRSSSKGICPNCCRFSHRFGTR